METLALCIPAFNAEKYLQRLLDSAKKQLIPFDQILVYDDASTDGTAVIAKKNGVNVISGLQNVGCSAGKNIMAKATGCDWIHFHDADDELMPEFTTLAFKWINGLDRPDVVLFNYEYRDNFTGILIGTRKFDRIKLETDPVAYTIREQINPFCGLYNKEKFLQAGGYDTDPEVLYNEDTALHIRLAVNGLTFSSENAVSIINYRVSKSMSASNRKKCFRAQFAVLQKNAQIVTQKHFKDIAWRLWEIIGPLAAQNDWDYVESTLKLTKHLGYPRAVSGSRTFKMLTTINPYFGVWFREKMIRFSKPDLRKG
jgi:glycosyltransferase involved in cell wall biosynthesis